VTKSFDSQVTLLVDIERLQAYLLHYGYALTFYIIDRNSTFVARNVPLTWSHTNLCVSY